MAEDSVSSRMLPFHRMSKRFSWEKPKDDIKTKSNSNFILISLYNSFSKNNRNLILISPTETANYIERITFAPIC